MVPLEGLAFQAVVVTLALLGLQDLVPLAPLVTKDNPAFLETLGPQACQVRLEDLLGSLKVTKTSQGCRVCAWIQFSRKTVVAQARASLTFLCLIFLRVRWVR